jgi:hypothetical protein
MFINLSVHHPQSKDGPLRLTPGFQRLPLYSPAMPTTGRIPPLADFHRANGLGSTLCPETFHEVTPEPLRHGTWDFGGGLSPRPEAAAGPGTD